MRLKLAGFGAVAVALAVAPLVLSDHRAQQLAVAGAYFVAILGLDLLGQSGQVSLGQGAFMAVGAFTAAILCGRHGYGAPLALLIGAGVAGAVGLLASLAGRRGLTVLTLAFALALPSILHRVGPETSGAVRHGYAFTWLVAGVLFIAAWLLVESRFGRVLRAVRDNELGAAAAGVNGAGYRAVASMLAAAYAGVGGGLIALVAGHVDAGSLPFELSLLLLAGAVLRSPWTALAGALAVELLAGHQPELVLGVALIVVLAVARTVRRT